MRSVQPYISHEHLQSRVMEQSNLAAAACATQQAIDRPPAHLEGHLITQKCTPQLLSPKRICFKLKFTSRRSLPSERSAGGAAPLPGSGAAAA